MTIVAIHQPNFFPWLGYFDKISRSDVFIFLDDVQYQKTGGSWSNRVKVLINCEGRWLTAPVDRSFHGSRYVNEMEFSSKENWRSKLIKSVTSTYKRTPFFDEIYLVIEALIKNPENNVATYNIHTIKTLTSALGYSTKSMINSSDLRTESSSTERLIELIMGAHGKTYLCGGGSSGYQEDEAFHKAGIKLSYQNFLQPTYTQFGCEHFVGGLSIIDALMNLGFEGTRKLIGNNVDENT
jgi:hypothetical protein